MIENIVHNNQILAIIIPAGFNAPGVTFCTPNEFSQQLAFMSHPASKVIEPHIHNPILRNVHFTLEVLIIKKGRLRIDFYDDDQIYLESRILNAGDVILLSNGGHGFEVLEDLEMVEIKQGPYAGDKDKTRFKGIDSSEVKLKAHQNV